MKIAVIGATGKTGSEIVQEIMRRGHTAIAVAYGHDSTAANAKLIKRQGNILDQNSLRNALVGAEAVIVSVGSANQFRRSTLISTGIQNVLAVGSELDIHRVVLQSGITVSDGRGFSLLNQLFIRVIHLVYRNALMDKRAAERTIIGSPVDWSIVRPVGMSTDVADGQMTYGERRPFNLFQTISFADSARAIVAVTLDKAQWSHKIVHIGKG